MNIKHFLCVILVLFVIGSCGGRGNTVGGDGLSEVEMLYSKELKIYEGDGYTVAEIRNPWDTVAVLHKYVLLKEGAANPGIENATVVVVPIKNVAVYTSVHASVIELLGEVGSIKGVCEGEYIDSKSVKEEMKSGRIVDFGSSMTPNVEMMLKEGVGAIIATPFVNGSYGAAATIGVPIIEGADYMEAHPLGRAEWIKLYSRLFDKKELGDSLFNETCRRYNYLMGLVSSATDMQNPTVMSERNYGSQWYAPGGRSYVATLYKDAGGDYILAGDSTSGSLTLSLEKLIEYGVNTDIWLIKYNSAEDLTYEQLKNDFPPCANFKSFKDRKIYGCNTGKVPYYAEMPIHPYHLLEDYIMIFHPNLLENGMLRYFTPLE